MANLILRPQWQLPERAITPERDYQNRRHFLRQFGFSGAALLAAAGAGCSRESAHAATPVTATNTPAFATARRNPEFNPELRLSAESSVLSYNNFYEFSTTKDRVQKLVGPFTTDPWSLWVGGLCEQPFTVDARELAAMFPPEERVYRFRCVEAWAMVVPWTGFPLARLVEKARPKAGAKFLRFQTAMRPDQMPGIGRLSDYPWPYNEGLRLDEAMNPLTLLATGLYGKPLAKQNGAPIRIVVPWKYGYKSIKSIVRIEFTDRQPATFWEALQPEEYPFESNVNPAVPHPRWSQARERMIDTGEYVPTQKYNGYGQQVAALYGG